MAVLDHPVPEIGDDDILVKTVAVAQNPTDYKCAFPEYQSPRVSLA